MADLPKVEVQNTAHVLRELRDSIAAAQQEVEAARAIQARVDTVLKQVSYYEKGMETAKARIVRLLIAQLRYAECTRADDYIARIEEGLADLADKTKAAEGSGAPK